MIDPKSAVSAYASAAGLSKALGGTDEATGPDFMQLVGNALTDATNTGYQYEKTGALAVAGKTDLVDLVTATASAELTLQTVVAVRDKVISAYQDILKMPI